MRATWPGARSGRMAITTWPLVVSMRSVFSGSSMFFIRSSLRVRRDLHPDDLVGVLDDAVIGLGALLQRVHGLHPFDDFSDHGVLPVQRRRFAIHNEELRVSAVRIGRARHAYHAAGERHV